MRKGLAVLAVGIALAGSVSEVALTHNNNYAFPEREIRGRAAALRWLMNQTFPDWGPHETRCRGLGATRMRNGSRGYIHIRCRVESMRIPDFIYHINNRGRMVVTRSW